MWDEARIKELVRPGYVAREIYTDRALFDLEMERIFGRSWIYVGHDSQVRSPGDYFSTWIGTAKVIVVRHSDGKLHAFHNRCTHRGSELCPQGSAGKVRTFVCPYHAWTFRTDGELAHVPAADGYQEPDAKLRERRLDRVPRIDSYRGFIFASLAASGPSLADFLGPDVLAVFDNLVDRAPEGEVELAGGRLVQSYRANWKFQIENSVDMLHPSILHANAVDAARGHQHHDDSDPLSELQIELIRQNGQTVEQFDAVPMRALRNGHCYSGGWLEKEEDPVDEAERFGSDDSLRFPGQAEYKASLIARHGRQKAEQILSFSRHNTIVYPNLFVNSRLQQVRFLRPRDVNQTEQHCFIFRLKGAPDGMFRLAVRALNAANSPTSVATTDDHEVFELMQSSLASGADPWLDFSRGLGRDRSVGEGWLSTGTSELVMRNQHRAWVDLMTGAA